MVGDPGEFDAVLESAQRKLGHWHRGIPALGGLILVGAVLKSIHTLNGSGILLEAILDLLLIGSLGLVILFIWIWLPNSSVPPRFYPRIVSRVFGGVAVMALVLALRVVHPGVTVQFTFGTQAVLVAIGTIAGMGIGVYEAQTLIQSELLAEQNEELKRTEQRLEETVTELEESNDRLEQFAYAASHDLREPLRMVTRYLELIDDRHGDALDEDGKEFLAFAVDGAERMSATIDGLLEYSRVETQGEAFEPVDLDDVLDAVCADLQFKIEETETDLTRDALPTVDGDERQLQQLFQNLVSNAIDYSGDEPPRVHVSAAREGSTWAVSVRDEGIGIDPDDTDRIFDVFQRLHSSEERDGSGIGLALCSRVVERHGGEIRVESTPGDGSTFSVTLPPAAGPSAPTETAPRPEGSTAGSER